MADLDELRPQMNAARTTRDEAARAQVAEEQRLRALRREASDFARRFDPDNPDHQTRRLELNTQIDDNVARATARRVAKQSALEELTRIDGLLAPFTDPRVALPALEAKYPILLFPVRLETRFVTRTTGTTTRKQLLVRIYPDECLVDGFEPDLSEAEVKNLRRYWCATWAAGGDEGLERAAWRELCGAHGAGRAMYLVQHYLPLAGSDAVPVRGAASDVILVVAIDAPLSTIPDEKTAISAYWEAVWRAGSDDVAKSAAFDTLRGALSDARAEEVRLSLAPFNIKDRPLAGVDRATVPVSAAFVLLPPLATAATKRQAWTRPPEAALLPERFVLFADSGPEHVELLGGMVKQPLAVGPDPLAEGTEQFSSVSGDLIVPPPLAWMTDFEAALAAGMAFQIDLTARQASGGFDRLYVLGVRLTADDVQGRTELEKLIGNQAKSQSGFAIVPQGTPTNNSEAGSSGWSRVQEADELFELSRLGPGQVQFDHEATAVYEKRDGLLLAEALGIDATVLQDIPNADGMDQAEARAMNAALWPATLGYWMDTQMRPAFDPETIERTRRHFINRVTGRGCVPAIRIGTQPYGILPTMAFSRMQFASNDFFATNVGTVSLQVQFLQGLRELMNRLAVAFWNDMAANAPRVGKPTSNSQQQVLDILGLHPSSVEFHLNVLDSADRLWNGFKFHSKLRARLKTVMQAQMDAGIALLRALGYTSKQPEIIEKFFAYVHGPMNRPVIDDPPLSETDTLTICFETDKNYIEWCRIKAQTAFDDLRLQRGFNPGKTPNALLYHMLRHALQLGYYQTAVVLHANSGLRAALAEPAFVHIAAGPADDSPSESRYQLLYARQPVITGPADLTVAQFIPSWLAAGGSSSALRDQIDALSVLEQADTASLERAFAEHIDLCSYRWDAWMLSLVNDRLHALRRPSGDTNERHLGIYLGAFGWLEELRPDPAALPAPTLSDEQATVFIRPGDAPLQRDPTNGGHVLAPSLNHAVTAAVLRNGYLSNAAPATPDLFAIDVSSARVRISLQFIEGMRNGQPLGALLGYQFERRLHDRYNEAEMDHLIYQVRKAFPLASKRIKDSLDTPPDWPDPPAEDAAIEQVEARNVCDGELLLKHVRTNPIKTYPWGKDLEAATPTQQMIIDQEVAALFEIHDAIADIVIAESVHQVTTGNTERAAAALDAFSKGDFPPEPDVVTTPRSGVSLTHRVGLHLPVAAVAPGGATPRAQAEPAIDAWLETVLPPLSDIVVRVHYKNTPPGSGEANADVDMDTLGLRPIDVVHLLDTSNEEAMNELDDRLLQHVISTIVDPVTFAIGLCPDASVEIRYTERVAGKKTAFEVAPLIASLRSIVLDSRPLQSSDAQLQNEAAPANVTVPFGQITAAHSSVEQVRADAFALQGTLTPLIQSGADFATAVAAIDAAITSFVSLQFSAGLCGVALASAGAILRARREWFELVRANAAKVMDRWQVKLAVCDALLAEAVDPTRSALMQIDSLERAEREVSTSFTSLSDPALLAIVTAKRDVFATALAEIQAVHDSAAVAIDPLWTSWSATFAGRPALDLAKEDTSKEEEQVRNMLKNMHQQVTGMLAELNKRIEKSDEKIAEAATAGGRQKAELLTEAAKALLGEAVRIIPRFTISEEQGDEWQNAFDARLNLLTHLAPAHDFPVDDWLHGVARVRAKLHKLENVILLADAFGTTEPTLAPVQFPFRAAEPWLAMEFPPGWDMSTVDDHLLYTGSYFNNAFDKTAAEFGGLLIDEWTEVVPATKETAGLAFNYDRPSHEPPQTMLLVSPAGLGTQWNWEDLRAAIPETFELAKKRAVEPRDISRTPLARLLPATLMAFTTNAISISSELRVADVALASPMEDDD
ncbi:MAG TPA: hypothetical protein VNG71_02555 [Pyrinomonadaceae bacterium]|nr:hypothetical protein [Pyrinomonadaceae bacterium]